ncbi:pyridoxamine 5'-phosphate oxidase [soil metagenome]
MGEQELAKLRREYAVGGLDEADLTADPITMFLGWLRDARAAGMHEPNAMVVATAAADGKPSARLVLLKALDAQGFVFFTNYGSRKAEELAENPACALLFPWHDLERQVRVDGHATQLSSEENAAYFGTRPRGSQLGAWASPQSQVVASRAELDARYDAVSARFGADGDVPLPPGWGGFRVLPDAIEFWQGRTGRMHDRLRYRRIPAAESTPSEPAPSTSTAAGWNIERLAP